MSASNEISDSLIQDVLECNKLATQWSEQLTGSEGAATDHTADHSDAVADEPSLASEPSAEPVAEHRIPHSDTNEHLELPQPLRQLISTTGVKLVAVPSGTWNIEGFAAKLRRSLTHFFNAFLDAGVEAEEITSIQYRGSNRSWCISFRSKASKDCILEKGVVHLGNVTVFLGDADLRTVIVKIYEAPLEMPDTVVIGHLSHYGCVLSFRCDGSLQRFGLPARPCSCPTRASPKPAEDAARRATWHRVARNHVATISRPLGTWHQIATLIPCAGYVCCRIIMSPNVPTLFLALMLSQI